MARRRRRNAASVRMRGRERGVALVAVLLLVAGLIAIATAVVVLSASQRRAAQRAHEADARREVLDGALRVALAEISFGKVTGPFWHPRQPRIVSVAGKRVEVTLERESGRIDLNTAEEKYLVAGLVGAGLEEDAARTGAARIRDWIDPDDAPSAGGGAELQQYRDAQAPYEPRNAPFESTEEIRQVLGLEKLDDEALDAFTVYAQLQSPATFEATPGVRRALTWLANAAGEGGVPSEVGAPAVDGSEPVSYAGSVIRLRACMEAARDTPCRETVQRMTGSSGRPYQVLAWRDLSHALSR
jgi:general secretion pathway protein K